MQERESAEAVAAAGLGAMYYVIGHNRSDLWGATREAFALKDAAADIGDGPATVLLRDAAAAVIDRQTGAASVNLRDKDALRAAGLQQVSGVIPVLGQLPPDAAEQVRQWILRIAAEVAEASHDVGETDEISSAEQRALQAIHAVLTA